MLTVVKWYNNMKDSTTHHHRVIQRCYRLTNVNNATREQIQTNPVF